ncbi:AraC family transcriptional regulator [Desulfogranum marinum]|uniref:AraC family transcriptional regulator n=1 Tax=Desulfogranum marinum TaxID=453220 RepID=UPI0029C928FE|nr:AraC family transcriptional regulator [Desulfogranum marinum]
MKNAAKLMSTLAHNDGFNQTTLPDIGIYKATEAKGREPLCYNQGIIIVGQGSKRVFMGDKVYEYNPDNYLVLSVPIPAECETFATKEEPLLALTLNINIGLLNRIISQMDEHIDHTLLENKKKHQGIFAATLTPPIKDTVLRLLRVLQSPMETSVLGEGLVYELLFRVMQGANAASLYALAIQNTNLAKIDKALKRIHSSYADTMNVDALASLVNMSPSAFHRAFHDVTASSPIQYLKKIRLNKAKDLLTEQKVRVGEAATGVGYESTAQFSREFKRYFGNSPSAYSK